jgi:hypothetical protein
MARIAMVLGLLQQCPSIACQDYADAQTRILRNAFILITSKESITRKMSILTSCNTGLYSKSVTNEL